MAEKTFVKDLNLIGAGTTVEGKIRTQGSLRLDGKMTGEIHAAENLAIGATGEIEGMINGKNITVGGKVKGNISAVEKLVLEGKSVVKGDMRAARLVIDEGATFDGKISMTENRPGGQGY
ncbi:MAG: polymer-forming cytoskeletal protein [Bacteroidetes bacterium]|nr:polymer-forming cytoskeletal protein [Bacteroidota bacterium]